MSETKPGASRGLLDSLGALTATLLDIAYTRLDLLSADLDAEREHFLSLLTLALVALFCLGVGVLLSTLLLVVAFWDSYRLLALAALAGLFLLAGIAAWRIALRKARAKPRFFATSMAELLKDRQQLVSRP
jgi:uncharacterized membrane protein YqjE